MYCEHLIKFGVDDGGGNVVVVVDVMIQNIYMYLNSILCNLLLLGGSQLHQYPTTAAAPTTFISSPSGSPIGDQEEVIFIAAAIILVNALLGITTSLFLKVIFFKLFNTIYTSTNTKTLKVC